MAKVEDASLLADRLRARDEPCSIEGDCNVSTIASEARTGNANLAVALPGSPADTRTAEDTTGVGMKIEDDGTGVGAVDGHAFIVRAADDELAVALQRADEVCRASVSSRGSLTHHYAR